MKLNEKQMESVRSQMKQLRVKMDAAAHTARQEVAAYNAAIEKKSDLLKVTGKSGTAEEMRREMAQVEEDIALHDALLKGAVRELNSDAFLMHYWKGCVQEDEECGMVWFCRHDSYQVFRIVPDKDNLGTANVVLHKVSLDEKGSKMLDFTKIPNLNLLGFDAIWLSKLTRIAQILAVDTLSELAKKDREKIEQELKIVIPEGCEKFEFSKSNLKKSLHDVLVSLIGEELAKGVKVIDARFFKAAFESVGKKKRGELEVSVLELFRAVAEISYRIVNNGAGYGVRLNTKTRKMEL